MTVIDKILTEWSFRCHDGIVDMNDPKKLVILDEILIEKFNITLNENVYSKFLSISDLKKDAEFPEDETRGDTVNRFVEEEIPFMLSDGSIKILKFYNDNVKDIFDKKNYNELKKVKVVFVDKNNQEIKLKDIVKTDAFGGLIKGSSTQYETLALNDLNNQIKNILQENNLDSITVIVGNKEYPNISGAENQPGTVKSDFNLIDLKGNPIIFISHKKEGGSKSFARWGGFNFAYEEQNPEVLNFIENINSKISDKEFKRTYNFSQKISSDLLKKRIVFGQDFGKEFGIYNVQMVAQGKVYLEKIKNNLYKLTADKVWLNGDLPSEKYEPVLNAHYRTGYNQLGFKNCEQYSITISSAPKDIFPSLSQSEEQPLDNKYIKVPPEARLGKEYVDKEWLKNKPTEIIRQFDTSKELKRDGKEWIPLSNNSTKKLKEDLIKEFTTSLLELFDTDHFQLRVSERGNVLDILNMNEFPLKDYKSSEVKEKLKNNISTEIKNRAEILLKKDIPSSVTYDVGIKVLKPILVIDKEKYPIKLFAISTKEIKDKEGNVIGIREIENKGTMYLATIADNKLTTLLLLDKEDDNDLYFQIKSHVERKKGEEREAKILTPSNYIYEIDLDELMGKEKEKQAPTLIDPSTLPYKVRTDYRVGANFEHEKFGTGTIVATSAGSGGKGDSRGTVDWVDVKYPKPFLKGGKLIDVRRFENILTLVSPSLAK